MEPHMRLWLELAEKQMSSRDDHMIIVSAIKTDDPQLLEVAVRQHVESTIPALRDWMTSDT